MGRGVSYPSNALLKTYYHLEEETDDYNFIWEDFVMNLKEKLKAKFKSLDDKYLTKEWLGNEDKIILENDFVYVGVSEYCGLVCLWISPKENNVNLEKAWINKIEKKFYTYFGELKRIGTFSNGESVFELKKN